MNCVKLYKLYHWVPSPLKILDKLFYSEPFIEKFSTFELKTFSTSYSIAIGIIFDEEANKNVRRFLLTYYIAGSWLVYASCMLYLIDLKVYDAESLTFPITAMIFTSIKFVFWWFSFYLYDTIKSMKEFFIEDIDRSDIAIFPQEEKDNGLIKVKKLIILLMFIFFGFHIATDLLLDPENDIRTDGLTGRLYLIKFFPLLCPFENVWAKQALSLLQDAIVLPEICVHLSALLLIFIAIIEIRNKFTMLLKKIDSSSKRTFERIELLDKGLEETVLIKNERIRARDFRSLDEEKVNTMAIFFEDFVSWVKRYQQLHRYL